MKSLYISVENPIINNRLNPLECTCSNMSCVGPEKVRMILMNNSMPSLATDLEAITCGVINNGNIL